VRIPRALLARIPLGVWVLIALAIGFTIGSRYPKSPVVKAIGTTGTYFPKTVVTFAAVIVFFLLSAATARLVLVHRERAGLFFRRTLGLYLVLGLLSLVWVSVVILAARLLPGAEGTTRLSGGALAVSTLSTFRTVVSQQPLVQVLVAAPIVGWTAGRVSSLQQVARALIRISDAILAVFKWLIWYYPIMIGCLALLVPAKFGSRGISAYGSSVLWLAVSSVTFLLAVLLITRLLTRRTWSQLLAYLAAVYPTGFGTGGSYDTLAVNVVSAQRDLGLTPQVAEISIVFGTILNKCAATMAVMLCTVAITGLMHIPLSLSALLALVLPLWVLGLESPGIPGGAGFFMSPVVAAILQVPDPGVFITTFVALYSGLIPMLTTGVNTVCDGFMGALLQDRFAAHLVRPGLVEE
jgi:Na+/H+-dicarboxylate symporter